MHKMESFTPTALPVDTPVNDFDHAVATVQDGPLKAISVDTVQANIGLRCNMACLHCHVESSPKRQEEMSWETMEDVLAAANRAGAKTLDITGGAPEMHPRFNDFVVAAVRQGLRVMVRTNLTIHRQPGYESVPAFLAAQGVHLVASLPCYLETNVDRQRGKYVYRESIAAIQRLNELGYGDRDELPLDLVYNPGGPSLPPAQADLEAAYRRELAKQFGIRFTNLYTITNMPIGRLLADLERTGRADAYLQLLRDSFNPATLEGLMCRHQLQVGWDGTLHDCDFNYALHLPVNGKRRHVRDFHPSVHTRRLIATSHHCFGCTAGCGSSCTGALA